VVLYPLSGAIVQRGESFESNEKAPNKYLPLFQVHTATINVCEELHGVCECDWMREVRSGICKRDKYCSAMIKVYIETEFIVEERGRCPRGSAVIRAHDRTVLVFEQAGSNNNSVSSTGWAGDREFGWNSGLHKVYGVAQRCAGPSGPRSKPSGLGLL
jgi:hypothetical protein